jgi:hypothetical protein
MMSRRTPNMSDYEPDDEGQPTERLPGRRYADRGNVPVTYHNPQRTPPTLPQVHHPLPTQMPPQFQPAQRKYPGEDHSDDKTDL